MSAVRSLLRIIAACDPETQWRLLDELSLSDKLALADHWESSALPMQREPGGDWRTWLILAGRGYGKTRAGAEWVLARAREHPGARIALIEASLDEVAQVMVEGESGLLACAKRRETLRWRPTTGKLRFPTGAVAIAYSGAMPGRLRGPQHHFAWADEIAKWARPEETWDNLQLGMRLGERPRVVVTTTPGRTPLLGRIIAAPGTEVGRGRTFDNPHLPQAFVEAMREAYGGTRLGRQELDGEMLGEADGALWTREVLERCRVSPLSPGPSPAEGGGELRRVVVGVDPPASDRGDACGIVVCALLGDGRGAVLADCSIAGARPERWAKRVVAAVDAWSADRVIAEANNGGLMVETVLRTVAPGLPVRLVHASRGKAARAEPVAAAFEAGKCVLAGHFPELEDELTAMTPGGYAARGSPDRADAMVWALSELVVNARAKPRVRGL